MPVAHATDGDEVDFQYSHYQEGKRDVILTSIDESTFAFSKLTPGKSTNPIEVEGLHGHGIFSLTDRIKFAFNYTQDTWGGATPIASAPAAFGGEVSNQNTTSSGETVSSATPYINSGQGGLAFDRKGNAYVSWDDPNTGVKKFRQDNRTTHILSTASPETRKQGDFKITYEWDEASLSAGGGISIEDDYESRFGNIGGRLDLNNKLTSLNLDLSYTNSDTHAVPDHDANSYVWKDSYYYELLDIQKNLSGNLVSINGNRQDWGLHAGVSQVLSKDSLVSADFNYTRSTGYMANPYKTTEFFYVDPAKFADNGIVIADSGKAFIERRPEVRNQWGVGGRYVQHIEPLDASLHLDYRFSGDDWGINAHTFEVDWTQPLSAGWTITPRIRYYSQDAADFYAPYFLYYEKFKNDKKIIKDGIEIDVPSNKLPAAFSSDHRLSGFGTLSGGVTIAKKFSKGITLETGFEYYTHQGSLKIGGGGEGSYADFDYWLANAVLKVDLNALAMNGGAAHHVRNHMHHEHGGHAPAGVMFDHMLPKAGDFMVGYRYMWNSQSGAMLNGTGPVNDAAVVANGCIDANSLGCFLTPDTMNMSMHMLDLMYAPTEWLTLMLMPQFMDMNMSMRKLEGASPNSEITNVTGTSIDQHLTHHIQNTHETGGLGDLGMYALFKVFDNGIHHIHATAGFSAPTADVDIQLRRNHAVDGGFIHYGMQLGSGTWDFKPSVTYTGHTDIFSWGAQASGILRMEDHNKSGYRLGDLFQTTAWGSYNLTNWLTASVRGVYTIQGAIKGQFIGSENGQFGNGDPNQGAFVQSSILKFGSQDYPANYGGRFWDVGFGLSAMVPSGDFAGNRLAVEWLQPVHTDYNGYQLDRDGALSATWFVIF